MNSKAIAGLGGGIAVVIIVLILAANSDFGIDTQNMQKNEKLGLVINTPTSAVTLEQLDQT